MDDFGDTSGTAGAITLNTPIAGDIEEAGDVDWFSIHLEAGKKYRIRLEGEENANGTLADPVFTLFDDVSAAVPGAFDDDSGPGLDSELIFEPGTTGTYYLQAAAFGSQTGTYSLSIVEDPTSTFDLSASDVSKDEGDTGLTPFTFTVTRTGDLSQAASVDWAAATASPNNTSTDDFDGGIFPFGSLIFAVDQSTQVITVNVSGDLVDEDDEYFSVTLSNASAGTEIGTGSKIGVVLDDDSPTDSGTADLSISGVSTVNFEGQLGTTEYTFEVMRAGNTTIAASATWNVEAVLDGPSVDGDDFDGGLLPTGLVSFNPGETSKLVTVLVSGDVDDEPNEVFSIDLTAPSAMTTIVSGSKLATIVNDEDDDFGQTPGSAGGIVIGGSKTGNLETGIDEDWFCVQLQSGTFYQIDLEGDATGLGTLLDPLIEGVYDSNGIFVPGTVDDDGGTGLNSRLVFSPDVSGAYYISAASHSGIGTYTISIAVDPNDPPTGTVTISGDPKVGRDLTASNTLADADGMGDVTYQWQANGVPIIGATDSTYAPTDNDLGKTITVVASYTDGQNMIESVSSAATAPVIPDPNIAPTGTVTISGIPEVDEVLTASNDLADVDGLGPISYQWFTNGAPINGATAAEYTPNAADLGKTITVVASYTDLLNTDESVGSAATAPVTTNTNDAPTGSVTITGEPTVGEELTVSHNLVDRDGLGPISYQWYVAGVLIIGATDTVYSPTFDDLTKTITVVASYTDLQDNDESVSSDETPPVNNAGDLIEGTSAADTLVGGIRDDTLVGFDGRDQLEGKDGDDDIQGGADIDTAVYAGLIGDIDVINLGDVVQVQGGQGLGTDTLTDVERLKFDDMSLAMDLNGNAGLTAKLLGALLGADNWFNREYVGIGIDLLDNGGFEFEQLMGLGLQVVLGQNPTNTAVVTLLFTNLVGQAPSQADLNEFVPLLDNGIYTQSGLAVAAAQDDINLANIGFSTLIDTGLEFIQV